MFGCDLIGKTISFYLWRDKIKEVNEEILEQVRPCNTCPYEPHLTRCGDKYLRVDFYIGRESMAQEKSRWGPKISLTENSIWNNEFICNNYNGVIFPKMSPD